MTQRKRSITIAGLISAVLILLPGTAALLFSARAMEEVRTIENRKPVALAQLMTEPDDWQDPAAWSEVAAALSDRIPLRVKLTRLLRGVERDLFGRRLFDKVVVCPGPWMYYRPSLDHSPVRTQQLDQALSEVRSRTGGERDRFYLAPAPDKVSIYPEALCTHRVTYDALLPGREALHRHFAAGRSKELIDTWTPLLRARRRLPEQVYFQTDTHFNARGALIYARTLVDAIAPEAWAEPNVTIDAARPQRRDLTNLAGLPGPPEATQPLNLERPGVHAHQCHADGEEIDCAEVFSKRKRPTRTSAASAGVAPLIPGRTLIIHDSFVEGFLKPVLWQFFEDLSYTHIDHLKPGELSAALADYDRVIVSRVERNLGGVVRAMAQPPADTQIARRLGLVPKG